MKLVLYQVWLICEIEYQVRLICVSQNRWSSGQNSKALRTLVGQLFFNQSIDQSTKRVDNGCRWWPCFRFGKTDASKLPAWQWNTLFFLIMLGKKQRFPFPPWVYAYSTHLLVYCPIDDIDPAFLSLASVFSPANQLSDSTGLAIPILQRSLISVVNSQDGCWAV